MRKSYIILCVLAFLVGCDKSKEPTNAQDGKGGKATEQGTSDASPAKTKETDLKAVARAALEAKFDAWFVGADTDPTFRTPAYRTARLLSYDIKTITQSKVSDTSFDAVSVVELETSDGVPSKRQLKHYVIVERSGGTTIVARSN